MTRFQIHMKMNMKMMSATIATTNPTRIPMTGSMSPPDPSANHA
jgi:hypothetical protein